MLGITGKVVAVTGASSGIGEAIAVLLAERGARVVLAARRADHLAGLTARITNGGGEAAYACADVTRREDIDGLVRLVCDRYGRLDVFVSNAGIMPISPLADSGKQTGLVHNLETQANANRGDLLLTC